MDALKVALASDWFYPKIGGIETHIHELALQLLEMGHEPHVITHDYRYMKPYRDDFPYAVHRIKGFFYFRKSHVSLGVDTLFKLNRLYKTIGFDITHIHSIYSPFAVAAANLSRGIRGVPVVATNHSLYYWSPVTKPLIPLLRNTLKRVDAFIAVSRRVAEDTRRLLGIVDGKVPLYIIPNGVNTGFWRPPEAEEERAARRKLGLDEREFVVLVVGRFTERKRIHQAPAIVAYAAKIVAGRRRLHLLIIGDGPLRSKVLRAVEEHLYGLDGVRVTVHGFMGRAGLREAYWASDLLLVPARLEAFSIAALEAMACGRPVIGFRDGGIEDVVADGRTGFLVSSDEEASERIAELALDPNLHRRLAETAPLHAAENFSWTRIARSIVEVYRATMDAAMDSDKRYLLYRAWLRVSRILGR
ncbi:glycosyltransferase family 4 protein [Hyperthermus butylicus]|uniref:Glycosyltransferase n=1 Tax=Hyperthermus butylicus (strain DSM 5456 / JCM 9403 / PLM1-5) TaxID=415426 RepID=A2BLS7_HYPBU|nr:glycosyltransferase family 4 protein [Hyperthermus butylicus]ABM80938.1 glycosyltransferase [Hyperthermus butylicus DSM 5456]